MDPVIFISGTGAAGLEIAFTLYSRWKKIFRSISITLIDSNKQFLGNFHAKARKNIMNALNSKKIRFLENATVIRVTRDAIHIRCQDE